jgi:hypothetical protein
MHSWHQVGAPITQGSRWCMGSRITSEDAEGGRAVHRGKGVTVGRSPRRQRGRDMPGRSPQANRSEGDSLLPAMGWRQRVSARSPVRKNRTPGAVRGASSHWRPYRDGLRGAKRNPLDKAPGQHPRIRVTIACSRDTFSLCASAGEGVMGKTAQPQVLGATWSLLQTSATGSPPFEGRAFSWQICSTKSLLAWRGRPSSKHGGAVSPRRPLRKPCVWRGMTWADSGSAGAAWVCS